MVERGRSKALRRIQSESKIPNFEGIPQVVTRTAEDCRPNEGANEVNFKGEPMKTYRHGDVIVREVKSIPTKAKELSTKKAVLALGEVTGHSHQVNGALAFFGFDEERYLKIQRGIGAHTRGARKNRTPRR